MGSILPGQCPPLGHPLTASPSVSLPTLASGGCVSSGVPQRMALLAVEAVPRCCVPCKEWANLKFELSDQK